MKICRLVLLCLLLANPLWAQDTKYPVATPTDQPGVVISPYDSTRRLDVAGLEAGGLAEDPIAKEIFRIPYPDSKHSQSSPRISGSSNRNVPPPSIGLNGSQPKPSIPPLTEPNPVSNALPTDLLNFIYAFNQNSTVNDPDALIPFYADTVDDYFGRRNVKKSSIRADRVSYIKRYPQREYILDGPPVLLGQNSNIYEVMMRVRYTVEGNGRSKSGEVSDYFKIRRGARKFEIIGISEAKASAAPANVQRQDSESPALSDPNQLSIYSQFELEQIDLFLDAFAASGEVNDASATVEFMHPQITTYYSLSRPPVSDILKDRRDYLKRWPERRYWLTEPPVINPRSIGSWDVVTTTGYEVKNGSKKISGVATSDLRLVHTNAGLKIISIKTRK